MFTAVIREDAAHDIAPVKLLIPTDAKPSKKGDRILFSATYESPVCIPAAGHVSLITVINSGREASPVLAVDYNVDIPTISWGAGPGAALTQYRAQCLDKRPPEEIEVDFPGYRALPAEKWVQLNKITDQFVIQLKLQKMVPTDARRNPGTGEFYVYGITRFIVQVDPHATNKAPQIMPKTDKDRALLI